MTKEKILDGAYKSQMHWNHVNRANVLKAMQQYSDQENASLRELLKEMVGALEKCDGLIKEFYPHDDPANQLGIFVILPALTKYKALMEGQSR